MKQYVSKSNTFKTELSQIFYWAASVHEIHSLQKVLNTFVYFTKNNESTDTVREGPANNSLLNVITLLLLSIKMLLQGNR